MDSIGNIDATGNFTVTYMLPQLGMGILFGPGRSGNLLEGNTIADNHHAGFFIDQNDNNVIRGNIFYNNESGQLRFAGDDTSSYGNIVEDNMFFSLTPGQIDPYLIGANDFASFDRNFYGNTIGEIVIRQSNSDLSSNHHYALAHWQSSFPALKQNSLTNSTHFEKFSGPNAGASFVVNSGFDTGIEDWNIRIAAPLHDTTPGRLDAPSLRVEPSADDVSANPDVFRALSGAGVSIAVQYAGQWSRHALRSISRRSRLASVRTWRNDFLRWIRNGTTKS